MADDNGRTNPVKGVVEGVKAVAKQAVGAVAGPKPDQVAPELRTATGTPVEGPDTARGQQDENLTTAQGVRLYDTDHSLKASERGPHSTTSSPTSSTSRSTRRPGSGASERSCCHRSSTSSPTAGASHCNAATARC